MLTGDDLPQRLREVQALVQKLPRPYGQSVEILAVSKYASDEALAVLAAAGQRHFAESRPQAMRDRAVKFPDLYWHMIGPVQKNKAKYIGRHATVWHSVEDADTAHAVAAHVQGRRLPVLLQADFSAAANRHGVAPGKLGALYREVSAIGQLEVIGLMCMAMPEGDTDGCFSRLHTLGKELFGQDKAELSMGMSNDFHLAVAEGATMIRLGRCLFDPVSERNV
ncbi:MAG: YggS family pyridoxal phosphate-dependent enzyme [Mariprofundaceae bacterium]